MYELLYAVSYQNDYGEITRDIGVFHTKEAAEHVADQLRGLGYDKVRVIGICDNHRKLTI